MKQALALLMGLLLMGGCVSVEATADKRFDFTGIKNVAVIEVSGKVSGEAAKNQIADMMSQELLRRGYQVVERSQVATLLKEQKFQAGDLTDSADAARAGKILNVDAVVVANIPRADERVNMTVKMLQTETGRLLWMANGVADSQRTLITVFSAVAGAAAGVLLGREVHDRTSAKVLGAVVGGVLGGAAGYKLSPSEERLMRRLIRRTFENLPPNSPFLKAKSG